MKKFLNKALMVLLVVIMALSSVPVTNIADIDSSSPFAITAEAAKKTIKFKKSKPSVYTGEKYTLKLLDKKGKTISAKKIKWTTANKKIATVDKNGVVKGIKAGKVKITATYKKKKHVATVTVKDYIKFKKSKPSVYIGEKYTLKLVDKKGKAISNDKIKWATADKKIATVSDKGVVKGKKEGKVKITATYKKVKYTATVTVKNIFSLDKSKLVIPDGDTKRKTIKVTYKGEETISYQVLSGSSLIDVKWAPGWDGDVAKLYITAKSKASTGTARIKVYEKENKNNVVYIDVQIGTPVNPVTVYEDGVVKVAYLKTVENKTSGELETHFEITNKTAEDMTGVLCNYIAINGYTLEINGFTSDAPASKGKKTIICRSTDYKKYGVDLKTVKFISAEMSFVGQKVTDVHQISFANVKVDKNAKPACPAVSGKKLLYSDADIDIYFGNIKKVQGIGSSTYEGTLIIKNKTKSSAYTLKDRAVPFGEFDKVSDYLVIAGEKFESYEDASSPAVEDLLDELDVNADVAPGSIAYCKFVAYGSSNNVDVKSIKTIEGQLTLAKGLNETKIVLGN